MSQNRWVTSSTWRPGSNAEGPVLPSLEAVYLSDPAVVASVIPPPLEAPPEPRVHARITTIDLQLPGGHSYQEKVGYFAVDAVYEGTLGEYPLMIPIDLESAVAISRERFGEPKKLAEIEMERDGGHVEGRVARHGVTFIEMAGDVAESLPVPEPYPATQFWFKFLPRGRGPGLRCRSLLGAGGPGAHARVTRAH